MKAKVKFFMVMTADTTAIKDSVATINMVVVLGADTMKQAKKAVHDSFGSNVKGKIKILDAKKVNATVDIDDGITISQACVNYVNDDIGANVAYTVWCDEE